jgi:zinc transporter ZupT
MVTIDAIYGSQQGSKIQTNSKMNSEIELPNVANNVTDHSVSVENAPPSQRAVQKTDDAQQLQRLTYQALLSNPDVIANLIGEALHNLNDGIAIATAFTVSWKSGTTNYS